MSKLPALVTATHELASVLITDMVTASQWITEALEIVQRFDTDLPDGPEIHDTAIDLWDFALLMRNKGYSTDIEPAGQAVLDAVDDYIIAEGPAWKGFDLSLSRGVSIFFPPEPSSFYNGTNFAFATGTVWPAAGGAGTGSSQEAISWGSMLVEYLRIAEPYASDVSNLPKPRTLLLPPRRAYLPLLRRDV